MSLGITSFLYFSLSLDLLVNHFLTRVTEAHLPTIGQDAGANAGGTIAFGADQHHIRDMKGCFLLDDACLSHCPSGSGMSFDKVDTFNYDTFVFRVSKAHLALLTLVLAGDNQDCIVLSDFHSNFPYKTSGASEIILVKFFSRNSRATGPKIRVPLGLFFSEIITAAFSSNLM